MDHRLLQARQSERKHGKNLSDQVDGGTVIPEGSGEGVEPGGMAEGFGQLFQPVDARLKIPVLDSDGAAHRSKLFGGHAGVANENQPGFGIAA